MRILLGICLFVAVASQAVAQTNDVETRTITVTNWVKPGPYLRVVDGVTYNVAYSTKWKKFQDWESLGFSTLDPSNDGQTSHSVMESYKVFPQVAFIQINREHFKAETYTGMPYKTYSEPEKVVAVLNCEHPERVDYYCMRTTNYISKATGDAYPAYDCGVQATNLVPVVKQIKVVSTNASAVSK